MAATPAHGQLDNDVQGVHVPFQFSFADEASRMGAPASRLTGGASKLAYQRDTSSLWLLASASPTPTWASMGAGIVASGLGGISEGANLGTGIGVFREKTGASLLFKTLVGGTNITIASAASTVTLSASIGHFSKTVTNAAWNNDMQPLWQAPRGGSATIVEILATTSGTLTPELSFNIQHRDWDAMQSAGTDMFAASQVATSAGEQFTSFARATVDPRAHLMLTTGSGVEGGSVKYLQLTGYYTI